MAEKKALMSMADIQKQLDAKVTDTRARIEKPAGATIGIKGKKFTFKQDVIGRVASFVIVDFIRANKWYDEGFQEDVVELPACMALSVDGEDMAPVPGCPSPQNEQCDGCELNAWGSADVGRGKACAEQYVLAVLAIDPKDKKETYANCPMAMITCPPTSKKNYGAYVRALEDTTGRPPLAFLTEMSFDDDFDHPVLEFEINKPLKSAADLSAVLSRADEAREMLLAPPDFTGESDRKENSGASKKKKKKVVKKKGKKKVAKKAAKKKATKKKAKKTGRSKYA